ncbi:MAG TPA: hypothetical protein VKT27_15910 [Candidatus Binataceae bacterium]|nr:hypothetical protein [Candidatus Binataceae bacterium]
MKIKRREFLRKSALMVAGVSAAAAGASVAGLAAEWTAGLKTLDPHQAETLLRMARRIYPHDRLSDAYYIKVVEDLDAEATAKPATARMLKAGVTNLDRISGGKFANDPMPIQIVELKKIERTPFFDKVRSTALVSLYNNRDVWKEFGYQGASYPFGGYLHHGFNDLKWLPDPPESASPKPA